MSNRVTPEMATTRRKNEKVKDSSIARSFNFFGMRQSKSQKQQQEDIGLSIFLYFTNKERDARYMKTRKEKYALRLKFGSGFTAFFIPLLVIMQINFKVDDEESEPFARFPLVMVFPGIVFLMGLLVISFQDYFQKHTKLLALACLIGVISALLDTTKAGTDVTERNVWVLFIFTLGVTSSTGIVFLESIFVLISSGLFLIVLAWAQHMRGSEDAASSCNSNDNTLSSAGTLSAAVILYTILLIFLSWNWEYEERRDFILTERLGQENVMVQMTMEMTGWFSGGAATQSDGASVLSANCHIDPKDVQLEQELGSGTFGCVYSATWKETKVAVKKLYLNGDRENIIRNFGAEATLMAQLRHPNVVMFMGVMVHAEFVGVVMELCPKGSVYDVMQREDLSVDWTLLLRMLVDAARGMHFLHRNSPPIVHRDLKSLNLLIDADWRCKVSDFGLSKLKTLDESSGSDGNGTDPFRVFAGSAMWLAPEIYNGENYTESSDVYSFGIILYEVLTQQLPYQSISQEAIPFVVQSGKRPTDFKEIPELGDPNLSILQDLMKECWGTIPEDRPSFSEIMSRLQNIVANYIGMDPWEDHIVFPDRKLNTTSGGGGDNSLGFSIDEKDVVVGEPIGKGVFGAVYQGTYFGTPVAIKKLFITGVPKDVLKDFNKETNIMRGLRHPNIVLFMGSCCNPPSLLLVTELLLNGSFFDIYHKRQKPAPDEHLQLSMEIALDMARGLAYLHNHDPVVIHRDLKSQNILLDERMKTKIGDFGLSKFREAGKTMSICGSPLWVAPEVLRGEKYGCPCDVFSFAVIVWEALAWSEPYPNMGSNEVMNGVACGSLRPVPPDMTPKRMASLLKDCWSAKPNTRPTFDEIVPLLESIKEESFPSDN